MDSPSVREVSERIDALLDDLGRGAAPAVTARVEELLACVMQLYGAGLRRVVESVDEGTLRALAEDDVVANLLVLHDLHPDDVDTRVQRALDQVRPYLGSHAGGVSLSEVDADGVVHLRLEGSCDGCPSSAMTVQSAIEDAILAAAPDVVAVDAEGMVPDDGPALLQIQPFRPHDGAAAEPDPDGAGASSWVPLRLDVPPRTMSRVEAGAARLVVANLDGTLVAYLDRCPTCFAALSAGTLAGDVLACPAGHAHDARLAGRSLTGDGAHLAPLPLLPEHGAWKVAVPREALA